MALDLSPSSCCTCWRRCVGFQSPSSLALIAAGADVAPRQLCVELAAVWEHCNAFLLVAVGSDYESLLHTLVRGMQWCSCKRYTVELHLHMHEPNLLVGRLEWWDFDVHHTKVDCLWSYFHWLTSVWVTNVGIGYYLTYWFNNTTSKQWQRKW